MTKKTTSRRQKKPLASVGTWQRIWDSQSETTQHAVSITLLIVVSLGFYAPIHFSSARLIAGDTVQWRSMASDMLQYNEETGETALWSHNAFGGMPGYVISYPAETPQIDVIPSTLRSFMWPSSHLILLFLGMYLLVWGLTENKLAAVFSSISFGLTTYMPVILLAGHNTKFIALAWAPWLLLAFIRVIKSPDLLSTLFFAIMAAVHLRAGHVQITYYVVIVCAIWWLLEGFEAFRDGRMSGFGRSTALLLLGSVGALLMLAQPYWSMAEYKQFSIRGASSGGVAGGLSWEYAMAWSEGGKELLTLLIANAFGGAGGLYWGPKTFTGGPHYFGGLTIALALYGVATRRSTPVVALAAGSVIMILFSLGEHFPLLNRAAFDHLPFFSTIRVPETWLSMVAMNVSILSGIGITAATSSFRLKTNKSSSVAAGSSRTDSGPDMDRVLLASFGTLAGIVTVLLLASTVFLEFSRPDEPARIFSQLQAQVPDVDPDDPRVSQLIGQEIARRQDERINVFDQDARRTLFFLVTGFIFLYLMQRRKVLPWLAITGLIFLATLDLGGVGRRFINPENLTEAKTAEESVPRYPFDDFLIEKAGKAGGRGHFRVLSLEMGRDPETNARPSNFHESLGGYSGAKLRSYQDFLDHILFTPDGSRLNPNALAIMNVRYLVGRRPAPGFELVYQDDVSGQAVFENLSIPSRAYFVGASETIEESEKVWARLADASFDPRETVILSDETGHVPTPVDSSSEMRVLLMRYANRLIQWHVETDAPRWMVISEMYYPAGWTASIDGQMVPIHQANYVNRAIFVPAGTHEVEMRFDPPSYTIGTWVSRIATLLIYGLMLLFLVQRGVAYRRKKIDEVPIGTDDRARDAQTE